MPGHLLLKTIMEFIAIMFLLGWFVISAICQTKLDLSHFFRRYDFFSMIPSWTFFAPKPGTTDFHLFYRDKLHSEHFTNWKEIYFEKEKTLLKSVWNPEKRKSKTLFDLTISIPRSDVELIKFSMNYLILLNFVVKQAHSPFSAQTQFLILESFGFNATEDPKILFISDFHKLSESQ